MLTNGNFESGWYDASGSLQIPNGWTWWQADASVPNPHSPDSWNKFVEPELRVLHRSRLPAAEQPLFILDGDYTLKLFKGYGAWYGQLSQSVTLLSGVWRFTVQLYGDLVKAYDGNNKVWADDPQGRDGLMCFWLNGHGYDWMSVKPGEWSEFTFDFAADGQVELGVELMCPFGLNNSGFFADAWTLERVEAPEPPQPGRGAPRVQYRRTVNVVPGDAAKARYLEVAGLAWDAGRETVTGSYDDAGIGDLDDRMAVLWDIPAAKQQEFTDWYAEHYPGVVVTFQGATDAPPEPPTPTPLPNTLITLHMQTTVGWWDEYFRTLARANIPARWVKFVGGMESSRIVEAATGGATRTVYRHFVESQRQEQLLDRAAADPYGAANSYLDEFFDGVLRNPVHAVESINEVIECGNVTKIQKAVKFDAAFAELVYDRSQGRVAPVTLTAPPGNPEHGAEVELLLPAVKATCDAGGLLGPHTYFPANGAYTEGWMESEGYHHHLRPLLSWDATFAQHGLQPRYLFGEAGAVGVEVRADGRPGVFAPTVGWRTAYCLGGDLARYIKLLLRYQDLVALWNEDHDWRAEGFMIFTTGIGIGWHDFLFNEPEIRALAEALG